MFYVEWNERTVSGLAKIRGCVRLLTEVAPDGTVKRELGFDAAAKEVHRAPTQNSRGLFDLVPVDTNGLKSTIGAQEFESLWSRQ